MGRKDWKRKQNRKPPDDRPVDTRYWHTLLKSQGLGVQLRPLPKKRVGPARKHRVA